MTQHTRLAVPVSERDHQQGPETAIVTLVQYGDYECPYTRQSTWVVQAIQKQLGDQLRFVFRNFPLTEIHPHALHAALAAEAAASQGKFWQMHDDTFHHQHTLEDSDLVRFAEALSLNMQQYASDVTLQRFLPHIEEDVESGERSGVQGTPTFFINGVMYRGSWERAEIWPGADQIPRKAYSHEVIRCGFWSGNEQFNEAAFFAYSAPSPPELEADSLRPSTAFYSPELSEFLLLYEDVGRACSPEQVLLDFFHSTYEAGATLAHWDRESLERHPATHTGDRP